MEALARELCSTCETLGRKAEPFFAFSSASSFACNCHREARACVHVLSCRVLHPFHLNETYFDLVDALPDPSPRQRVDELPSGAKLRASHPPSALTCCKYHKKARLSARVMSWWRPRSGPCSFTVTFLSSFSTASLQLPRASRFMRPCLREPSPKPRVSSSPFSGCTSQTTCSCLMGLGTS